MSLAVRIVAITAILTGNGSIGCTAAPPAPAAGPEASLVQEQRISMGSPVHLSAWTADGQAARRAFEAAFGEFDRLDRTMSVWRDGSDILRLNAAAGDHPVQVSADVRDALHIARQVSEWTGGKFDVTFGALGDLWKFDENQDNRIPDRADILRRLPLIDYTTVEVNDDAGTAFVRRRGAQINLGGIGKGYAVDRAAAALRAAGLRDFMIQAGGDLYVAGHRDGRAWRLGIRDPRGPAGTSFAAIELSDATLSTSGDYERFFMHNGRRYHHILDPDTGEPARVTRSVTMVTGRAVIADALAKGIFILGPNAGMALVERLPDVEAVIVGADNTVRVSSGLTGRLVRLAPPTDAP